MKKFDRKMTRCIEALKAKQPVFNIIPERWLRKIYKLAWLDGFSSCLDATRKQQRTAQAAIKALEICTEEDEQHTTKPPIH